MVDDDDLSRLDALAGPVQFQAFVEGYDVRVHTVGGQVFATRLERGDDTLCRLQTGAAAEMEPCELEPELAARCVALAAGLGLDLAGIDLRITPSGEAVCFEVNPSPGVLVLRSAHRQADGRRDRLLPRGRRYVILLGDDARENRGAILATLVLVAAVPSGAAATAFPLPDPTVSDPLDALVTPGETMRLSDELKVTRWANANTRNPIRSAPQAAARTITRLRYVTEDKLPEVYLVLSALVDASGEAWLRLRIPMRPNGRTGWVNVDKLGQLHVVRTRLVISRSTMRATLYRNGSRIWQAPVGVGKAATPTPKGNFYVRELLKGDGKLYGTWASARAPTRASPTGRTAASSASRHRPAGAHPGAPVARCVRVRNVNINRLWRLMPIGTPIQIIG